MVALAAKGLTPFEFLLGRYEPLPKDLGIWKQGVPDDHGWAREERLLLPPGGANRSYLRLQVRYRDLLTHEMRVEPERRVRRRRVSARS